MPKIETKQQAKELVKKLKITGNRIIVTEHGNTFVNCTDEQINDQCEGLKLHVVKGIAPVGAQIQED